MTRKQLSVHRIYIGNISFDTSKEELREFFVRRGVAAQVQFLAAPKTAEAVSGGFAFISVLGDEQLAKAMVLDREEGPRGRKALLVREALPRTSAQEADLVNAE
jgi:hypothetical protein